MPKRTLDMQFVAARISLAFSNTSRAFVAKPRGLTILVHMDLQVPK